MNLRAAMILVQMWARCPKENNTGVVVDCSAMRRCRSVYETASVMLMTVTRLMVADYNKDLLTGRAEMYIVGWAAMLLVKGWKRSMIDAVMLVMRRKTSSSTRG
jgi:hypothetical protein